jgi:uncharacterized protein YcbX
MGTTETVLGTVAEIWRFPVKSFGGERLTATDLDAVGIPGDRRMALRDTSTGKVLSAKTPGIGTALLECSAVTTADGHVLATVAGATFDADAERDALAAALGAHLGRTVTLADAVDPDDQYESYWPEVDDVMLSDVTIDLPIAMSTEKARFVDLAALQMVATSSLDHLRRLLPDSRIETARFRPGLVIDTAAVGGATDAFVENGWTQRDARLGGARIRLTDASPRCVMTTLAQHDLPRDRAVLQTLAKHNRIETEGLGAFACLGIYAEVLEPGPVREGDALVVTG